jgi:glyoxylase-like metal-dependent hydrolase (beta-lactamase superfamily II)
MMAGEARYRWTVLRAGPIRLDGGGMFGVIPRVLWSKAFVPDDVGRITLAQNCILLEREGAVPDGEPRTVLIETGSGDKFGEKSRKIFGLEDYSILDALREAGKSPDQIDAVIVSHLHFDHAGGLTRKLRAGETPDWTGSTEAPGGGVKLTFPRAPVFVQWREWTDALANRSVMTRTYLKDHLEPLQGRLKLVESEMPFPLGHLPEKDETPRAPLADRQTEILPGISVFVTPGHTWGQQAVKFTDANRRTIVFTPDVMPTVHHLGAAYNLAYDVEPYLSTVTRRWFLAEAAHGDWLLVLDHEPGNPCVKVRDDGKGWFTLEGVDA